MVEVERGMAEGVWVGWRMGAMSRSALRRQAGGCLGLRAANGVGFGPQIKSGATERGVAGMAVGERRVALVLFTSRYPRSSRGQVPRQARV